MYRTTAKKVFWEFDSIIMQNWSDILPLFCTPTWPSHQVSENQEERGMVRKAGKFHRSRLLFEFMVCHVTLTLRPEESLTLVKLHVYDMKNFYGFSLAWYV